VRLNELRGNSQNKYGVLLRLEASDESKGKVRKGEREKNWLERVEINWLTMS